MTEKLVETITRLRAFLKRAMETHCELARASTGGTHLEWVKAASANDVAYDQLHGAIELSTLDAVLQAAEQVGEDAAENERLREFWRRAEERAEKWKALAERAVNEADGSSGAWYDAIREALATTTSPKTEATNEERENA